MYGKRITIKPHEFHGCEQEILLRPMTEADIPAIVTGMQHEAVTRGTLMQKSPTAKDEQQWLDRIGASEDGVYWGIETDSKLIGVTSIGLQGRKFILAGETGKIIFNQNFWGKRVATASDMVRTWYGWYQHGITKYHSGVVTTNVGSWKSLQKCGYYIHGVTVGAFWSAGQYVSEYLLEWVHPDAAADRTLLEWDIPWGDSTAYAEHRAGQITVAKRVLATVPEFIEF